MKRSSIAYILWLFGGIFGLHHAYLDRLPSAMSYFYSFGGFGIFWLLDIFYISYYVAEANWIYDENHVQNLMNRIEKEEEKRPKIGILTLFLKCFCGWVLSSIFSFLTPPNSHSCIPWIMKGFGAAIGVCYGGTNPILRHVRISFFLLFLTGFLTQVFLEEYNSTLIPVMVCCALFDFRSCWDISRNSSTAYQSIFRFLKILFASWIILALLLNAHFQHHKHIIQPKIALLQQTTQFQLMSETFHMFYKLSEEKLLSDILDKNVSIIPLNGTIYTSNFLGYIERASLNELVMKARQILELEANADFYQAEKSFKKRQIKYNPNSSQRNDDSTNTKILLDREAYLFLSLLSICENIYSIIPMEITGQIQLMGEYLYDINYGYRDWHPQMIANEVCFNNKSMNTYTLSNENNYSEERTCFYNIFELMFYLMMKEDFGERDILGVKESLDWEDYRRISAIILGLDMNADYTEIESAYSNFVSRYKHEFYLESSSTTKQRLEKKIQIAKNAGSILYFSLGMERVGEGIKRILKTVCDELVHFDR